MSEPSAEMFLAAWEQSAAQPKPARPAAFLQAAYFATSPGKVLEMTVGDYDARMLQVRARLFGENVSAAATCPCCGEKLELGFAVSDLVPPPADSVAPPTGGELRDEEYLLQYRLPTVGDLQAAAGARDVGAASSLLLARCVVTATENGRPMATKNLPEALVARLGEALSQADPRAGPELALACSKCDHQWTEPFDAGNFVWSEIQTWAQQVLNDIHLLASAYGWTEREILALSPSRRRTYVELAQG